MIRMATYHEYYKDKGMYGNQTYDVWRTHIGKASPPFQSLDKSLTWA